jgi:putative Ca2+/H+ antiporter (TMEM165/GDT1 family)
MEAFLVSTGIVALAEMGDKTQLLALILAARFRQPWPIVLGIFSPPSPTTRWLAPWVLG